jgi:hypothetical protein
MNNISFIGLSPVEKEVALKGLIPLDSAGANLGSVANGTVMEYGNKYSHVSVISVTEFTQAVAGADLGFGKKIYDFPEGLVKCKRAVIDITMSAPTSTDVGEVGLGTVVASGAVATLGGTATFEDIVDGFANTAPSVAGAATQAGKECEAGQLDGTSTSKDLFLNFAASWTPTEDITISGTITLFWDYLGDY